MRNKARKLLCFAMIMVMFAGMIPGVSFDAHAATEIESITANGPSFSDLCNAAEVGKGVGTFHFSNVLADGSLSIFGDEGSIYTMEDTADGWYKVTDSGQIGEKAAGTFEPGTYIYGVGILLRVTETYEFTEATTLTVNGEIWTPGLIRTESGETYKMFWSPKIINAISLTGVTPPVDGDYPDFETSGLVVKEPGITVKDGSANWFMLSHDDSTATAVSPSAKIDGTRKYQYQVEFDIEDGYMMAGSFDATVNSMDYPLPAVYSYYKSDPSADPPIALTCVIPCVNGAICTYVVRTNFLNVRTEPGEGGVHRGGMLFGHVTDGHGISSDGKWALVGFGDSTGWVDSEYLALTFNEGSAFEDGPKYFTTAYVMRIRSGPSTYCKSIAEIQANKQVLGTGMIVNGVGEEWLIVDYETSSRLHNLGFILFSSGDTHYFNEETAPVTNDQAAEALNVNAGGVSPTVWLDTGGSIIQLRIAKPGISGQEVDVTDEDFVYESDGVVYTIIYPDDATNFSELDLGKIKLLDDAILKLVSFELLEDGGIKLKMSPKDPVAVTYESNGGSAVASVTASKGAVIPQPENPTKDGYTFDAWYEDASFGTKHDFESTVDESITLYARWLVNVVGVKLHANGAEKNSDGTYKLKTDVLEALFEKDSAALTISLSPLSSSSDLSDKRTAPPEYDKEYYFGVFLKCEGEEGIPSVYYTDLMKTKNEASAENGTIEFVELQRSPGGLEAVLVFKYTDNNEISYTFSKGADSNWTKASEEGLDYTVNRSSYDEITFSLFKDIEVDGNAVDVSNYTSSEGSLNASLKASYLETLEEGSHSVKIIFNDGSAETTLTISPEPEEPVEVTEDPKPAPPKTVTEDPQPAPKANSPGTGDNSHVGLFILLGIGSLIGIVILTITRKKSFGE
ncbi:MAG: InlB B-repeat-containing protein [Oscillospiraceae bacterium]|nr:InlB B-repeat-containing protein [Oscillospiraceae bacterium]